MMILLFPQHTQVHHIGFATVVAADSEKGAPIQLRPLHIYIYTIIAKAVWAWGGSLSDLTHQSPTTTLSSTTSSNNNNKKYFIAALYLCRLGSDHSRMNRFYRPTNEIVGNTRYHHHLFNITTVVLYKNAKLGRPNHLRIIIIIGCSTELNSSCSPHNIVVLLLLLLSHSTARPASKAASPFIYYSWLDSRTSLALCVLLF